MKPEFIRKIKGFTVIRPIEVEITQMCGLKEGKYLLTINEFGIHHNSKSVVDGIESLIQMIQSLWADLETEECVRDLTQFEINLKKNLLSYIRPSG